MTSFIQFKPLFLATHNAFSGDDETQLEICLDEFDSYGYLCDADAMEPLR